MMQPRLIRLMLASNKNQFHKLPDGSSKSLNAQVHTETTLMIFLEGATDKQHTY